MANIKEIRSKLGLSQPVFAKKIGIGEKRLRAYENGKEICPDDIMQKIIALDSDIETQNECEEVNVESQESEEVKTKSKYTNQHDKLKIFGYSYKEEDYVGYGIIISENKEEVFEILAVLYYKRIKKSKVNIVNEAIKLAKKYCEVEEIPFEYGQYDIGFSKL